MPRMKITTGWNKGFTRYLTLTGRIIVFQNMTHSRQLQIDSSKNCYRYQRIYIGFALATRSGLLAPDAR